MTQQSETEGRASALARLDEPFDLVVIGAGVNGAATAWDASLRGIRTLLIEQDDYGSGTSAWSSRFIHGGLKYLDKLEFGLVREALREREWLLQTAGHLVVPMRYDMPFYRRSSTPPALIGMGMVLYDVLSYDKSVPRFTVMSKKKILQRLPGLNPEGLLGGVSYYDAQAVHAERLTVEVVLAAAKAGCVTLNHCAAGALEVEDGRVKALMVTDRLTGVAYRVETTAIVNAAGPWVDQVLEDMFGGRPGEVPPRAIGGTKGSHLFVDHFPGAPSDVVVREAGTDGRLVFVAPFQGRYMIGSTDLRFEGDPVEARADDEEYAYLLREANRMFPSANLTAQDVLFHYTGVRPLPYSPDKPVEEITRRHLLVDHSANARGLYSIVGGKLTTFRATGADVADHVAALLDVKRPSTSRTAMLPGTRSAASGATVSASNLLSRHSSQRINQLYGRQAIEVLGYAKRSGALDVLDVQSGAIRGEIGWAVEHEGAATLTDVLARRLMLSLSPDLGQSLTEAVAHECARLLGWTGARRAAELTAYAAFQDRLRNPRVAEHGVGV
ncbi:glycerol-3-phosphate dehydrogenase/oxidase [Microbacterium sp. X-17]|uniref:glycerol-3-phosphate dehydrogenase/oxidase n=1 Tax=Microbacterium sp. X-17 TaxID=3144404 RepID=UPI0031F506E8